MNQKYLELFNKAILSEMAKDINKKLSEENKESINSTPEDVFKNLTMLYDTVQEKAFGETTGNSYRYMPKRYKAMVMRLIFPEYYPEVKISCIKSEDGMLKGICAEARLYLNYEDSKPVASGKQYLSFSSVEDQQFEDESDLHAYVESTVRGIALSKAYQEFGIGSWYTYQFEPEENPDAALATMGSNDGVVPTVAYGDDKSPITDGAENKLKSQENPKQKTVTQSQAEVNAGSVVSTDEASEKNPAKKTSDKTATKEKKNTKSAKSTDKIGMTLEKARSLKAPVGKASDLGLSLGETESKYPINILWMYTQKNISPEIKEALVLISLNNPKILNAFTEKGINIGQM